MLSYSQISFAQYSGNMLDGCFVALHQAEKSRTMSKNPPQGGAPSDVGCEGAWQDVTNVTNQGDVVRCPDSM